MARKKASIGEGLEPDIQKLVENIAKETKTQLGTLATLRGEQVPRVTSGSVALDIAMGGGWARGRIHEVYGAESVGDLCSRASEVFAGPSDGDEPSRRAYEAVWIVESLMRRLRRYVE